MKKAKTGDNKELESKVALFGKMPDMCLTCEKPFDKSDKEMALSWNVVVHGPEETVRLYCPDCWSVAKRITEKFKMHLEEKYGSAEE